MAIPKVMGIETEYGISSPGTSDFDPVTSSSLLIGSYAGALRKIRWDYEQESPMRDARGFEAVPARGGAEEDGGLANVSLPNGARYYVDHAHPEYSTPECSNARDLVIHDKAGERILERSLRETERFLPQGQRLAIYKNNSDGKGNSYGTHENYLVSRETPFSNLVRDLTPFFVSRQVFTGAGKLGVEGEPEKDSDVVFQLTQRADFFEAEVGLETTLKRPIINTRDEPHADPAKYRRLHVIVGDANMSEVSSFLKVGTTALVLKMIEDDFLPDLALANPVKALHAVSRDIRCRTLVRLDDGRMLSAIELQWEYLTRAAKWSEDHEDDPSNRDILQRWEATLTALEDDPMTLRRQVDWVAKYCLMQGYRERDGLNWGDHKLKMIDLQYHDIRRDKGLYYRLEDGGQMERLVTDAEVDRAMHEPPDDTRAYFRGTVLGRFPEAIAAASWDSLIIDTGVEMLQRIPMREPLKGTRDQVGELLSLATDPAALVRLLQG